MTDQHNGAADEETSGIGAAAAPGRERRMTAGRKRDAVLHELPQPAPGKAAQHG